MRKTDTKITWAKSWAIVSFYKNSHLAQLVFGSILSIKNSSFANCSAFGSINSERIERKYQTQNPNLDGFQNSSLSVFTVSVSLKIGSGFTVSDSLKIGSRFTMLVSRKIGCLKKGVMHRWTGLVRGQGGRIAETRRRTFVSESNKKYLLKTRWQKNNLVKTQLHETKLIAQISTQFW